MISIDDSRLRACVPPPSSISLRCSHAGEVEDHSTLAKYVAKGQRESSSQTAINPRIGCSRSICRRRRSISTSSEDQLKVQQVSQICTVSPANSVESQNLAFCPLLSTNKTRRPTSERIFDVASGTSSILCNQLVAQKVVFPTISFLRTSVSVILTHRHLLSQLDE